MRIGAIGSGNFGTDGHQVVLVGPAVRIEVLVLERAGSAAVEAVAAGPWSRAARRRDFTLPNSALALDEMTRI